MTAKAKRLKPDEPGFPHGEYRGYHWGCRCSDCKEAHRDYIADYRRRKKAGLVKPRNTRPDAAGKPKPEHGTMARYRQGCRCVECKEACRLDTKRYREEHPEALERAARWQADYRAARREW